jgi:hypothetical protein
MAKTLDSFLPPSVRKLQRAYGGAKTKRKPRVTLDELNRGGVEAFRDKGDEIAVPEDKRPGYVKVLDVLDVPGNAVRNVIADIAGVDKSKMERATFGRPRVMTSDILAKAGMKAGFGRSALGFVGDVALDPLVWMGAPAKAATALVRGAPRILPAGMRAVRAAAKTGKFAPELAAAAGARNAARISKVVEKVAKGTAKVGRHPDAAKYLASGQGTIARGLKKGFEKGTPETLDWLKKVGEKGPSLLGVPFTTKAAGTLTPERLAKVFGKTQGGKLWKPNEVISRFFPKASKMASVQQGIAQPGSWKTIQEAIAKMKAARVPLTAAAGKAAVNAKREAEIAKRKADLAAKAGEAVRSAVAKTGIGEMAKPYKNLIVSEKGKIVRAEKKAAGAAFVPTKAAKAELKTAKAEAAAQLKAGQAMKLEGQNVLHAAQSSPTAPGPVQQIQAVEKGHRLIPGKGILQTLQQAKRQLFGTGPSRAGQLTAGLEATHAKGSAKEAAAVNLSNERMAPIYARYAVGGETPETARDLIHALAEAGPNGSNLASYALDSPLRNMYAKAHSLGMVADPEVKAVVEDLWKGGAANLAKAKELGIPVKKLASYTQPRVATKEAAEAMAQQKNVTGNIPMGPKPGGKVSTAVPESIPRGRWNYYKMPDGTVRRAYSENASAKELQAAGGKLSRTEELSIQDWNKMATDPANPLALKAFGQAREGQEAFKGKLFETDVSRSFGAQARQQEHMRFVAGTRKMIEPYAVRITDPAQAASQEFAHLVKIGPDVFDPNGAFSELARQGVFNDLYLPPDIADKLKRLAQLDRSPQAISDLMRATDRTLGFWKTVQLMHPSYLFRNVWTNLSVNWMNEGSILKQTSYATSRDVWKLRNAMLAGAEQAVAGKTIKIGSQIVPQKQVFRFILDHNGVGSGRMAMHSDKFAGVASRTAMFQAAGRKTKGVTQSIFKANMAAEDMQRIGAWMSFVDDGLDWESAWTKTLLSMPDLADMTKFEKGTMRRLFPFYAWMRKNGANQLLHYLPQKPYLMASVPKMKNFAEGMRGEGNVPDDLRPEWMRDSMAAQVTGDAKGGSAFIPLSWTPFEETLAAGSLGVQPERAFKTAAGMVRPGIKFGAEMATGRNIFRGTEYQTGLNPLQLAGKVPQAFMGTSNTPLDSLLTMRPIREATQRIPSMQTPAAAAGRVFLGGAFQPVSRQGGLANEYATLTERARKIRAQIGRAQQANDLPLAKSLMVEFVKVQQRMMQLGLPGVPKSTQAMLKAQGVQQGAEAFPQRR